MGLPINIEKLLTGKTVEWERIEFKAGWNPLEITQTVTAFANDINNWGGGYVVVGVSEKAGMPVLPPVGLREDTLDGIQKELLNICNQTRPPYFPVAVPVEYMGKMILVIWAPGSETRPHQAPKSFATPRDYQYFIRRFSSTVVANRQEQQDLIETSARTPFDDQVQPRSNLNDLSLALIKSHLAAVGSSLLEEIESIPFATLCRKMAIVSGPDEDIKPRNIGLLLFNPNPTNYFPGAKIDIVQFKDIEGTGDDFLEKTFSGPVQLQLQDALVYIKNNILAEKVVKVEGQAEAIRAFNYPYDAVEEALVNTVYHRSYQDDSPIEVRVYPNRIELISYPGPLPPLTKERLHSGNIVARKYRNRRLGDFLKELRLTEGRGTGIPKIIKEMQRNGSPAPTFDTDDDLNYFLTVLNVHPAWQPESEDDSRVQDGVQVRVQDGVQVTENILHYCQRPRNKRQIMNHLGLFPNYKNYQKYVKPLVEKGWLALTVPDSPTSRYQEYRTTPDGHRALNGEETPGSIGDQTRLL